MQTNSLFYFLLLICLLMAVLDLLLRTGFLQLWQAATPVVVHGLLTVAFYCRAQALAHGFSMRYGLSNCSSWALFSLELSGSVIMTQGLSSPAHVGSSRTKN